MNPNRVTATIAVAASTPVRADTKVGLDFQGLTGVPVVILQGGSKPMEPDAAQPPTLTAEPLAGQSMTTAARDALRRLDLILADNAEPLRTTIANLNTFSAALARTPTSSTASSKRPGTPHRRRRSQRTADGL